MYPQPTLTSTTRRTLRWLIVGGVILLSLLAGTVAPLFAAGAPLW